MHPVYHLHYGGNRLDSTIQNEDHCYGDSLFLDSPRLAHPPMDAILGVDFVLTNYVSQESFRTLREDNQYQNLVKAAQSRVWRPYIQALAHSWSPVPDRCDWKDKTIWPQLLS